MRNEDDVLYGARNAINEVNKRLNASIKRNGGARTAAQVVNVFNDVVTNLHMMELDIDDKEKENEAKEDDVFVVVLTNLGGVVQ